MVRSVSRRYTKGARKGMKKRTNVKGKRECRTCRGRKQKTSSRNGKKVKFAKFETCGKNDRFRPTKGVLQPTKMADSDPSGYEQLLLASPCCGHMKNYQNSIVEFVRCERAFYFTHMAPKDNECMQLLSPSRGVQRDQTPPRVPGYTAPTQGRRQDIVVRVPPPTRRKSELYDEIIQERNKLHENAVRVCDFHRNECVEMEDEWLPEEPLSTRMFVDPNLAQHCPECEKEANWCDCPTCSEFI